MKTNLLATVTAITGLAIAGSAGAQVLGGSVGGAVGGTVGGALGPSPSAGGSLNGSVNAGANAQTPRTTIPRTGVTTPSTSTAVNGSADANANAGLASSVAPMGLAGLSPGMTVRNAKGQALGKVSRIVRRADGAITSVEVAGADKAAKAMSLAPSSLSIASGVVTTTDANAGVSRQ